MLYWQIMLIIREVIIVFRELEGIEGLSMTMIWPPAAEAGMSLFDGCL